MPPNRGGLLLYNFYKGYLAPSDALVAEQYVVAHDEKTTHFVMARKQDVQQTRMTRAFFARPPMWAIELCADGDLCPKGDKCSKLHATEVTSLAVSDDTALHICLKNGTNARLPPSQLEPTAGLLFACTLRSQRLVSECYPWVCQRYLVGTCTRGTKCLLIHVNREKVKDIKKPILEASTSFGMALQQSMPTTPGLMTFIDNTLFRIGLRTIGDMAMLSNTVFMALFQRDIFGHPDHRKFWLLLTQLRTLSRTTPLRDALLQYPGIDLKTIDLVTSTPYLQTVGDLCSLKPRLVYSLAVRAQLLDACEKIRARFEGEAEVYSSVSLVDLAPESFFRRLSALVCDFREKHAHTSWRKQDATRPIVTSAITWVDPNACKCSVDSESLAAGSSAPSTRSPSVGSRDAAKKLAEFVPSPDHWCQCPRQHQLAVNYELSTPSGSRCSEQNALGAIAGMGLPTSCIREVFVHGGVHHSDDPNPLFPCGVCENMFRRVSKDVQKAHGGDVTLYMFDQESNPRKLVCIPVSEISHREGSSFRRFVAEDLRDDGMSDDRYTPQSSLWYDEGTPLPTLPDSPGMRATPNPTLGASNMSVSIPK